MKLHFGRKMLNNRNFKDFSGLYNPTINAISTALNFQTFKLTVIRLAVSRKVEGIELVVKWVIEKFLLYRNLLLRNFTVFYFLYFRYNVYFPVISSFFKQIKNSFKLWNGEYNFIIRKNSFWIYENIPVSMLSGSLAFCNNKNN